MMIGLTMARTDTTGSSYHTSIKFGCNDSVIISYDVYYRLDKVYLY